ncbi:MAG: HDOD domain-containing protein [Phycisphaeraceae bacterium]|nr:HDOD domain-containing protein [Phycisphaeraceae bacterium]
MARIITVSDDPEFGTSLERVTRNLMIEVREAAGMGDLERAASLPAIDALVIDCDDDRKAFDFVNRVRGAAPGHPRVMIAVPTISRENVVALAKLGVWAVVLKSNTFDHQLRQRLAGLCPASADVHRHAAPVPPAERPAPRPPARQSAPAPANPGAASPTAEPAPSAASLADLRPVVTRQALLERLAAPGELPALAPAVREVLSLANQSTSSLDDVANAIRKDQSLSLRVLRVANSAAMSNGDRVDTVSKAVSRIGLGQVREIVLAVGVIDYFDERTSLSGLRLDWFWEHSIAVAITSRLLATGLEWPVDQCESAFVAGLLHDIGRPMLATMFPAEFEQAQRYAERLRLPLHHVEHRMFLMDHAEVGAALLRAWRMPPTMATIVSLHHHSITAILQAGHRHSRPALLLAAANELAHHLVLGHSGNSTLGNLPGLLEALKAPDAVNDGLAEQTRMQMADLKLAVLAQSGGAPGPLPALVLRRRLPAPPPPLAIWPGGAATRWLDEALREALGQPNGPPQGIIARVNGKADVLRLEKELPTIDAAAGGRPLPIVALGSWPTGLNPPALAGRVVAKIAANPHWHDLLAAIGALAGVESEPLRGQRRAA